MRNKGRIIALLAVVVVLFGAWFLLSRVLPGTDVTPEVTPAPDDGINKVDLVPFGQNDMVQIIMETPQETIVLNKATRTQTIRKQNEDGSLTTETSDIQVWQSPDLNVDENVASRIAFNGGFYKTSRRVVEKATTDDLETYGFQQPWKLTFKTADGEAVLIIGDKTPDGGSYYVMAGGSEAIYTGSAYPTDSLRPDRLAMINKNLYQRDDTIEMDITAIRFVRGGALLADAVMGANGNWTLTEPAPLAADPGAYGAMQMAFAGLTVTEQVAWATDDLSKYGLDKPGYEFEYVVAGAPHHLLIGGRQPDTNFLYCMMAEGETVFTVDPQLFAFLDKPFVELIDKFIFLPSIYETTYMTIEVDGRTDVMEFDVPSPQSDPDNELPETYILNGEKIEGKDGISGVKRYFQGAIGVRADKVDFEAKPIYEPEKSVMTINYKLRDRDIEAMKVELIPTPDGYGYYGFRNGVYSGLIVSRTQMDEDSLGIRKGYEEMNEKIAKDKAAAAGN